MQASRFISFIAVGFLLLLIVAVRYFETTVFPEPLHDYFHDGFQAMPIPAGYNVIILAVTALRYLVNTILSIGIIWFIFKKTGFVKAALWVYLFAFLLLFSAMALCLINGGDALKMVLFYVRRFLIHPLLLLILIAGFYYLRNKELR